MLAENRITSCAEDFGQRPLTSSIVTLYLPGHFFGRGKATHKNNDQFSPLGGKWTMANFRRTLDTAPASDCISGERSATAPDAEDFGQRLLTNNIVTLYLPGHYFGRSMATHKNNDQFSPLGGRWTMANFRRTCSTLDTAPASDPISGERSATAPDAEDFGQRPLTSNTVTLYLPGHYFGRSMATHKNDDQFSPLGGKWTMADFRRTLDTAPASGCPLLPMPLFLTPPAQTTSQSHHAGAA